MLTMDTVGPFIILLTTGEICPFDQYMFLTIVGEGFLYDVLDKFWIIDGGCYCESPFVDPSEKPAEETDLEGAVIGSLIEAGCGTGGINEHHDKHMV